MRALVVAKDCSSERSRRVAPREVDGRADGELFLHTTNGSIIAELVQSLKANPVVNTKIGHHGFEYARTCPNSLTDKFCRK